MLFVTGRTLALFLSHGGSLDRWRRDGILTREMMLYLGFIREGIFDRVLIFSYSCADQELRAGLAQQYPDYEKIEIIAPSRAAAAMFRMGLLWSLIGPFLHRRIFAQSDVIKTNQISGSWSAIGASFLTGKPLILRLGYILSRRFRKNGQHFRAWVAHVIETIACRKASHILITSGAAKAILDARGYSGKTVVNPPCVDTDRFVEKTVHDFGAPVITVARLTLQKNLENLIRACAKTGLSLTIYGEGPLQEHLGDIAKQSAAKVLFPGPVTNDELSEILPRHAIFVLPSLHEGLPKTLIEAMSCGLICAASDIEGVTDLIEDRKTGYLVRGFSPADIAHTLMQIIADRNTEIGKAARISVAKKFGLQSAIARENQIYAGLP